MRSRQTPRTLAIADGYWQLLKSLARNTAGDVMYYHVGSRKLPETMLRCNLPGGRRADKDIVTRVGDCIVGNARQSIAACEPPQKGMGIK